ncbi:MAG TPA: hypothetical protein VJ732_03625 [Bryobacteraceae bacterium]|nr:hypothetical protein [Bryobacteraceae bacterium]
MTPSEHLLYSLSLFFALASLLKWSARRGNPARRMERSLRSYQVKLCSLVAGAGWDQ